MLGVGKAREEARKAALKRSIAAVADNASDSVQGVRRTVQSVLEAMRTKRGVGAMRDATKEVQVLLGELEAQAKDLMGMCADMDPSHSEPRTVPPCLRALVDAEFGSASGTSPSISEGRSDSGRAPVVDAAWLEQCVEGALAGASIDKQRYRAPHECPVRAANVGHPLVVALCTPPAGGAATLCVYLEGAHVAFLQLDLEERGAFVVPRQVAVVSVEEAGLPGSDAWSLSEDQGLAELTEALRNVARYYTALARVHPRLRPWVMPLLIRWLAASGTLHGNPCTECAQLLVKSTHSTASILPIVREWRAAPLVRAIEEGREVPTYHPACTYWPIMT